MTMARKLVRSRTVVVSMMKVQVTQIELNYGAKSPREFLVIANKNQYAFFLKALRGRFLFLSMLCQERICLSNQLQSAY